MSFSVGIEKFYYLTVLDSCPAECPLCRAQYNLNPTVRDEDGLKRAVDRAKSSDCTAIVFPANFFDYPERKRAIELATEHGLQVILQFHATCWSRTNEAELSEWLTRGCWVEFVFENFSETEQAQLAWLEEKASHVYLTFVPTSGRDPISVLRALPDPMKERLYVYTPLGDVEGFLSCDEVADLCQRMRPETRLRGPRGVELWQQQISPNADLEPAGWIRFETHSRLAQIQVSVILITHQQKEHFLAALTHLCRQKLSRDFYEIVIVDDGSNDGSFEAARELIQSFANPPNFKYVFYPRRSTPLAQVGPFRTGPARNVGAKFATGPILTFLNAQLLCPNHFLEDIIKQHRSWDIVQYQRFFLKKNINSREYSRIELATDSYTSRGNYWERFYLANDWHGIPNFWKYTSFAGLSVKAALFHSVGGCMRSHLSSEIEGAHFGYKLSLFGLRWKLRNLPLYELFAETGNARSVQRETEDRQSAQLFYLNTLDPVIYAEYFDWLGERTSLRRFVRRLGKWMMGRWVLRLTQIGLERSRAHRAEANSKPMDFAKKALSFIESVEADIPPVPPEAPSHKEAAHEL